MKTLSVQNLNYSAGAFSLSNISFELSAKSYTCVVGETGSGKTVLLELLAGIRRAETGSISFLGKDITSSPPEKRKIGFAYQDSLLFPFLTVEENILLGAKIRGMEKDKEVLRRYARLLHRMGIEHLSSRKPWFLSGGERQRVSLARALLLQPKLLLLDEPLSALDASCRKDMRQLLKDVHTQEECCIIHVTHDIAEVETLSTDCFIMKKGILARRITSL